MIYQQSLSLELFRSCQSKNKLFKDLWHAKVTLNKILEI
jgi:hypothetical protein